MFHAHLLGFCALSVYYIKSIFGQHLGGFSYPHLNDQCKKVPLMLNDCNWCKCGMFQYQCEVRNCKENSDPFGHVNDVLKEVAVGMEGHGYWRSYNVQCAAHIQYQRENLLCVCNERSEWPSAACRDAFRVLYPIEQYVRPGDACSINKLYLIGCNVCICPTDGQIDKKFCTDRECTTLAESINVKDSNYNPKNYTVDEIYAKCEKGVKLLVEGKECECYSGNRIICNEENEPLGDNVEASVEIGGNKQIYTGDKSKENEKEIDKETDIENEKKKEIEKELVATVIFVKPPYTGVCPLNEYVKVGCNYCFCMNDGNGVCTTFKC